MVQIAVLSYPTAFAQWLCAADFAVGPTHEVAIIGNLDNSNAHQFLKTLWKSYRPRQVTAISAYPPGPGSPALLKDRPLVNNLPTAYVCQGFVCLRPVNSPDEMESQLAGSSIKWTPSSAGRVYHQTRLQHESACAIGYTTSKSGSHRWSWLI